MCNERANSVQYSLPERESEPNRSSYVYNLQSRAILSCAPTSLALLRALLWRQVDEDGEAGGVVDVRQATGLQIVAVGVATRKKERPADELLRQLITLPRPVNVEFARTINNATSSDHQGAKASAGRDNERSSASSKRLAELYKAGSRGMQTKDSRRVPCDMRSTREERSISPLPLPATYGYQLRHNTKGCASY